MSCPWPERLTLDVLTDSGACAEVEFRLLPTWVEVWLHEQRAAVLDRAYLSGWLAEPGAPLRVGAAELAVDCNADTRGRVAISLPGVDAWPLAPSALHRLRCALRPGQTQKVLS